MPSQPSPPQAASEGMGRLFLAVPLSDATRTALYAYVRNAARGRPLPGRTVPLDNWHLTLRFLGDTERPAHDRLLSELGAADLGPAFDITFDGLGAFPNLAQARVLWVGVDGGRRSLARLAEAVEQCCVRAGFPADTRGFGAHLTLSRLKPPADVSRLVAVSPASEVADRVGHVVLFRSHLGHGPVHYEVLRAFELPDATL